MHGDLKAENVLLRGDGSAVLSDFGISRITDARLRRNLDLTDSCEAGGFGTAYALAPECRDGALSTTGSDVYSFGVLMFKVVTGIWYDGSERLSGHLKAFAPKWSSLLEPMLQRDPSRRLAAAGELPENPFGGRRRGAALLRSGRGRSAFAAASAAACIILCVIAEPYIANHAKSAKRAKAEGFKNPGEAGAEQTAGLPFAACDAGALQGGADLHARGCALQLSSIARRRGFDH